MKLLIIVACILVPMSLNALAMESFLCTAEQVTGFAFSEQDRQWHIGKFKPQHEYVVAATTQNGWTLIDPEVGKTIKCSGGANSAGNVFCSDGSTDFRMNVNLLRFLRGYLLGYYVDYSILSDPPGPQWTGSVSMKDLQEGSDTPFIEIGHCAHKPTIERK